MNSKRERILTIDPGERVGWARGVVVDGALTDVVHGVSALYDFALKLGKSLDNYDTLVYETWRLYPHMAKTMIGNDFQPVQLVGIIRYLSWITPHIKLVSQGANCKKTGLKVMSDDLKSRLSSSSEQHDQDALMHLAYYYWEKYD